MRNLIAVLTLALLAGAVEAQIYGEVPAPSERVDIFSAEGKHLGCKGGYASSCNQFSPDSIENQFGAGNRFDPDSLANPYGEYGSRYSPKSWSNPYAATPPVVIETEPGYRPTISPYINPYAQPESPYKGDLTENPYNYRSLEIWDPALDREIKSDIWPD